MNRIFNLFCAALIAFLPVAAAARTLLVLPVSGEGIPAGDLASVNRLFRESVEMRYAGTVQTGTTSCGDRGCALEAVKAAGADEVVHSSVYKLGAKWIFSASVVAADGSGGFSQRLTGTNIEDMESLTVRMADALTTRQSTEQVASLDNITEKETETEPERRRSLYNAGLALGYLFPVDGSFDYEGDYAKKHYDQLIRFTWLNSWEFRNDLALGADITWSVPSVIGADLNLRYHLTRSDVSPFVGGGLGLHYVSGGGVYDTDERKSGPAVNLQGGMMLFRTYDVNVMLRGQYQVIFNDDIDHGPAIDVGVSFRDREKGGGGGKKDDGIGFWGYAGMGLLFLMIVGAAN